MIDQQAVDAPDAPTKQPQPNWIVRRVQKIKRYLHERSAEKKQENSQDRSSRRTAMATVWIAILTVAVLIVGGLQYITFDRQLSVMQNQLNEMRSSGAQTDALIAAAKQSAESAQRGSDTAEKTLVASNRPWVKVEMTAVGPITYNVNGVNFPIQYDVSNIGHAPATNVWIDTKIIAPAIGIDVVFSPRTELLKEISFLKTRPPSPFGFALFPGQTISQVISVSVGNEELKRITQQSEFIHPTIFGAVDYRIGFDDKAHDTGFIFEVRRSETPRPESIAKKRWAAAIFPDEGDIPATEVRIFHAPIDGGHAD